MESEQDRFLLEVEGDDTTSVVEVPGPHSKFMASAEAW